MKLFSPLSVRPVLAAALFLLLLGALGPAPAQETRPRRVAEEENSSNAGAERATAAASGPDTEGPEMCLYLQLAGNSDPLQAKSDEMAELFSAHGIRGVSSAAGVYTATAYALRGRCASGIYVRSGVIAADPRVLPLGTRVYVSAGRYSGTYLVADTGGVIKGRRIDIWMGSRREAMTFGRRSVRISVLGYGKIRRPSRSKAKVRRARARRR